jgi:hypothetical protein
MASIIDFHSHRRKREAQMARPVRPVADNMVVCAHCGERHPVIRIKANEQRCVTAFFDGTNWFCRNRGCRRAWLEDG